jgi:hypothetical protein
MGTIARKCGRRDAVMAQTALSCVINLIGAGHLPADVERTFISDATVDGVWSDA